MEKPWKEHTYVIMHIILKIPVYSPWLGRDNINFIKIILQITNLLLNKYSPMVGVILIWIRVRDYQQFLIFKVHNLHLIS
ncbi:hypothetical protein SAMN05216170_1350 [Thermococcus thioreducens]|uniref:Uncharacterized protein n=1 Tax=Thermococcus thioreducens TaxID=277988 RepID=A0A1I0NXW5_9EURY|nr:hypothetical protein SAMN05216170_1350 [Thermococcus thioreducens]